MVATDLKNNKNIAILGSGNLGVSIARGIVASGHYKSNQIVLTRRTLEKIQHLKDEEGFQITSDNLEAANKCAILIIGVLPAQVPQLLESIKHLVTKDHIIISVVLGITISGIRSHLQPDVYTPIVRAMPNTAIQYCESMTCIANKSDHPTKSGTAEQELADQNALEVTEKIFNCCGECITISEEAMVSAPALCSCGTAFFCRIIRAAASAGCEIGFHAEDAVRIAAQTAKGAAIMLLKNDSHPESEIDRITTPSGATIAGLNTMEHNGLSSAIIKGIVMSAEKSSKSQAALNKLNNVSS
ncbi:pyrroline-5-carboxylate reductase [Dictyostelium discoideum AX4]|uniref:Pyrroline-5-carboxylate reductase 2 n=1 Tax=Dictyostelium discoideum TaxID=44689 RepID=P5CR2_DICDI|nr:pyrroline-5-carboxylate reductase [Dictyostelium discoideum AX4]Q55E34.1 RecName: Full=Pyrroline-5-carboxylate reductase 2; Short=P5C reductase 2; Short=P5CR 2 [Dictyostelium discoideum]EAL72055.1 pyrroline-5-carboxylate reductase [Dictyostelium discoideum AX4]|eukprot:XP_645947.1 pyrroline-5-carboxylate reductase [Dictyostelium discoideum AX4]